MPAAPTKRFWHLESLTGGLDRRDGIFTKNQNRFYDLVNYRIVNSKKAVRRPPCSRNATAFVNCQGNIEWRGSLYTVAKKGDSVTKPTTVTGELRFDNPDHCTTWELAGLQTFAGYPVALIKHTYPGGAVTHQYRLHVFDGKKNKPTYVEDPWCPMGRSPTLPLHLYRSGDVGGFDSQWVPKIAECSGRLYMSRPDGNLAFSKTGNPRVWNDRTVGDIQEGGEWWYFIKPTGTGPHDFIVSDAHADLALNQKWSAYVMEYLDPTTLAWVAFIENSSSVVSDGHYFPDSIASRFAGGPNEIKLHAQHDVLAAGTIYRFRLIAGDPPNRTLSGLEIEANTLATFNGDGANMIFPCATILSPPAQEIMLGTTIPALSVYVGGVLKATPADYSVSYNSLGQAVVTFVAAPAAGTANIVITRNAIVYRAGVSEFEGSSTPVDYSQSAPGIPASKVIILGRGIYVDSTANPTLTPLGINGYTRYYGRIQHVVTTDATQAVTSDVEYKYASDPESPGGFFLDRTTEYQLNLAGADDAGDLPTSSQQGSDGGYVTSLSSMKDRLLVSYKGGTQLWQVSGPPEEHALVGFGPVGTGNQAWPVPAAVGQSVVVGMARGLMSLNLSGSNLDSLRDINLGEPIQPLGFPQQTDAVFWPETGEYVTAVTLPDASRQFLVFDHSSEQKINAWNRWTVASLPAVERHSMVAFGNKLYFRAGGYLYNFDLDATDYIDAHDATDDAYESTAMLHFNHLEAPFRQKQAVALEWVMNGSVTVAIRWNPDLPDEETGELVYAGMTAGRAKVPVSVWGVGLAPVIRSKDRDGHAIEELGMWFIVRER